MTRRSNFCFSLTTVFETFSSGIQSPGKTGLFAPKFSCSAKVNGQRDLLVVRKRHVVEEAIVCGRAVFEMAAVMSFAGLSQHVCRGVPEHLFACEIRIQMGWRYAAARRLTFGIVESQQFELASLLERPFQIPQLVVDLRSKSS